MAFFSSKKFFRSQIFIPFGRFRIFGDQTIKDAIALIGREDQRAFLIDALSGSGDRGAYLVTGRRGVGKTTFVENCLAEYEANVFRHFLRSAVGKNMADQILMLFFLLGIVAFGLLAADLLEYLVPQVQEQPLLYVILIPTLMITLFPFFLAVRTIKSVLATILPGFEGIAAFGLTLAVTAALLYWDGVLPLGSPALSMGYLLLGLALLMMVGSIWGRFRRTPNLKSQVFRIISNIFVLFIVFLSIFFLDNDFFFHFIYFFGKNNIYYSTVEILSILNSLILFLFFYFVYDSYVKFNNNFYQIISIIFSISVLLAVFCYIFYKVFEYIDWYSIAYTSFDQLCFIFLVALGIGLSVFGASAVEFLKLSLGSAPKENVHSNNSLVLIFFGYIVVISIIYAVLFLFNSGKISGAVYIGSTVSVFLFFIITLFKSMSGGFFNLSKYLYSLPFGSYEGRICKIRKTAKGDRSLNKKIKKNIDGIAFNRAAKYVPPVEVLPIYKAICLIIISIQLSFPIVGFGSNDFLARVSGHIDRPINEDSESKGIIIAPHASLYDLTEQIKTPIFGNPVFDENGLGAVTNPPDRVPAIQQEASRNYYTLFPQKYDDEFVWLILVVALIGSFFAFEYEWINKPFIAQRQTNTLDKASRNRHTIHHDLDPNWLSEYRNKLERLQEDLKQRLAELLFFEAKKENLKQIKWDVHDKGHIETLSSQGKEELVSKLASEFAWTIGQLHKDLEALDGKIRERQKRSISHFRSLESTTFPYMIARFFLPIIFVRVNLGFDALDHRGVTQAMLFGLLKEYRQRFVAIRTAYGMIGLAVLLVVSLMLMSAFSKVFVDFPAMKAPVLVFSSNGEVSSSKGTKFLESRQEADPSGVNVVFSLFPAKEEAKPSTFYDSVDQIQGVDYCGWLTYARLSGNGEGKASADKSEALIPAALCSMSPDLANALFPFLYAPALIIPDDLGNDSGQRKRLIYRVAHHNNGLPLLRRVEKTEALAAPGADDQASHSSQSTQEECDLEGSICLKQEPSLSFRVYHIFLLIFWVWAISSILRRFPLLPYKSSLQKIKDLSIALDHQQVDRHKQGSFSPMSWVRVVFDKEREIQTSRDPMDPRSVELAFMSLLKEVRASNTALRFLPKVSVSLPTPEIHFIFDELDKIGGVVGADFTAHNVSEEERIAMDAERQRAYALHALFSDMKRVISSAPAHFIFVGGRMLHDEWVRDLNRIGTRQPLLTGIFDAEIYLPSLMLDHPKAAWSAMNLQLDEDSGEEVNRALLSKRIKEFLIQAYKSAVDLNEDFFITRHGSFFALKGHDNDKVSFEDVKYADQISYSDIQVIDEASHWNLRDNTPCEVKNAEFLADCDRANAFLDGFVGFLAYRSAGAPKKMREILSGFVRTSGSLVPPGDTKTRHNLLHHRDSLVFDVDEQYRIEFINFIFRHIENRFGEVLVKRDDKVTVNIIFLFDFLMKFHGRAFSWSSLERLDELAHIHRAPDLRRIFDSVINESSGLFFHRLLNGLFSFRFRSELAMEIRYLSRIAEAEMAALNFTLDESQELKSTYGTMLNASGETNSDIIAALGELYEYDQAYEVARGYYERALKMCDEEFARQMGQMLGISDPVVNAIHDMMEPSSRDDDSKSSVNLHRKGFLGSQTSLSIPPAIAALLSAADYSPEEPFLKAILSRNDQAVQTIAYFMPWATRRLRLMLHIGLTFEQSGNEERALSQYHAAQMLARAITDAAFQDLGLNAGEGASKELEQGLEDGLQEDQTWLKQILKHLNLIFQPMFASAWVGEKLENGVDTSTSMVELELLLLRRLMPFLKDMDIVEDSTNLHHLVEEKDETYRLTHRAGNADSNFALVGAELHNKAGDLYFFKGRLPLPTKCDPLNQALDARRYKGYNQAYTDRHKGALNEGLDGYLLKAHYHFCVSMHEMRRFAVYRREISKFKLNPAGGCEGEYERDQWNTFRRNYWPTFLNQAAHNTLVDLAETALARSSMLEVWRDVDFFLEEMKKDEVQRQNPDYLTDLSKAYDFYLGRPFKNVQTDFEKALEFWFECDDKSCKRKAGTLTNGSSMQKIGFELLRDFLGEWRCRADLKEAHFNLVEFGAQDTAIEHVFMGLLCAYQGALYAKHAGLVEEASAEFVYAATQAVEHLKSIVRLDMLRRNSKINLLDNPSHNHFKIALRLAEAAYESLAQYGILVDEMSGVKHSQQDYRIGKTIMPHAATIACVLDLLLAQLVEALPNSSLLTKRERRDFRVRFIDVHSNLNNLIDPWFGGREKIKDKEHSQDDVILAVDLFAPNPPPASVWLKWTKVPLAAREQARRYKHARRRARARLAYMAKRHQFPMLNKMHNIKAVIDDVFLRDSHLGPGGHFSKHQEERLCEAMDWLEELKHAEDQYDAPMHFPPHLLADTLTLAYYAQTLTSNPPSDAPEKKGAKRAIDQEWSHYLRADISFPDLTALKGKGGRYHRDGAFWEKSLKVEAREYCRKARESFSQGQEYYNNISRLYYLYDDFNDRLRHVNHAVQMSHADLLALYKGLVDIE
ncbi:MAG: hypothetical protein N4A65_11480 [Cohaesibacter sp.]|jgi:hypothetical protein|nr:hypothetical protein [Cohaesibacter sp.]